MMTHEGLQFCPCYPVFIVYSLRIPGQLSSIFVDYNSFTMAGQSEWADIIAKGIDEKHDEINSLNHKVITVPHIIFKHPK